MARNPSGQGRVCKAFECWFDSSPRLHLFPGRIVCDILSQRLPGRNRLPQKLLVVGSINIDLVARASRIPAPGETILGNTFDVFNGGKGANQAVAAGKLSVPVEMLAALGTDLF